MAACCPRTDAGDAGVKKPKQLPISTVTTSAQPGHHEYRVHRFPDEQPRPVQQLPVAIHSTTQTPTTVRVKDPAMKGNVHYDAALTLIQPTVGLSEFLEEASPGKQQHKPCICKLWMEERCGQGSKCKSFHVCRDFIRAERQRCGSELDDSFLTEVAVHEDGGKVYAVGYNMVMRTRGLDTYRDNYNALKNSPKCAVAPLALCRHHAPGGSGVCPVDKACLCLHLKPQERCAPDGKQRTPCCQKHGDSSVGAEHTASFEIHAAHGQKTWVIPANRVALTVWLQRTSGGSTAHVAVSDVCVMHVRSRCKFGRSCEKLHLCRDWAEQVGLFAPQQRPQQVLSTAAAPQLAPAVTTAAVAAPFAAPSRPQVEGISSWRRPDSATPPSADAGSPCKTRPGVARLCQATPPQSVAAVPWCPAVPPPEQTVLRAIPQACAPAHAIRNHGPTIAPAPSATPVHSCYVVHSQQPLHWPGVPVSPAVLPLAPVLAKCAEVPLLPVLARAAGTEEGLPALVDDEGAPWSPSR